MLDGLVGLLDCSWSVKIPPVAPSFEAGFAWVRRQDQVICLTGVYASKARW